MTDSEEAWWNLILWARYQLIVIAPSSFVESMYIHLGNTSWWLYAPWIVNVSKVPLWSDSAKSTNVTNLDHPLIFEESLIGQTERNMLSHKNMSGIIVHKFLQALDRTLAPTAISILRLERILAFISWGRLLIVYELKLTVCFSLAFLAWAMATEWRFEVSWHYQQITSLDDA